MRSRTAKERIFEEILDKHELKLVRAKAWMRATVLLLRGKCIPERSLRPSRGHREPAANFWEDFPADSVGISTRAGRTGHPSHHPDMPVVVVEHSAAGRSCPGAKEPEEGGTRGTTLPGHLPAGCPLLDLEQDFAMDSVDFDPYYYHHHHSEAHGSSFPQG